ncbi:hypothetical protein ZIOFF_019001 [Zingiber officinale]|uniref:NADH dehydrogenase [ubiquinone] iron-sulfur protein 5 n=2 Tax=Zingiber officinale TaxID=94328 RepID=A0A8J5HLG5_ZINOF|nr:hypothetical protein ZIOFF_019001 [Zingiber officinale]
MCASSPQADPNFFYFSDQIVSKGKAEGREQGISESEMASGWGISGNKGRCYDFWNEFSECMSRCREPKECTFLREDYFECLHHAKEFKRRNRIYKEEQRQIRAAARKAKEEAEGDKDSSHH